MGRNANRHNTMGRNPDRDRAMGRDANGEKFGLREGRGLRDLSFWLEGCHRCGTDFGQITAQYSEAQRPLPWFPPEDSPQ